KINGEESRTLAATGAFRLVSERDLRDPRDLSSDARDDPLRQLRDAGLVEGHRDGKQVCYKVSPTIQRALANRQGQALDFGCCELRFPETALMTIGHVR
ncbi:MAG: hypothetical protein ACHQX3_11030, partial [Nitrospirales bacterium]